MWIARDESGELGLFEKKPALHDEGEWDDEVHNSYVGDISTTLSSLTQSIKPGEGPIEVSLMKGSDSYNMILGLLGTFKDLGLLKDTVSEDDLKKLATYISGL